MQTRTHSFTVGARKNTIRTYNFLKKAGTFYLATVDNDQPHVRPFGAICICEGKMYICTNNKKDCYKQILMNNKVEISAMVDNQWIRLTGYVKTDSSKNAKSVMLEEYPMLKKMYSLNDDIFEVLYLENAIATFNQFGKEKEVEAF
jgi:uncharacterized pyridoxamine 5'-phosphate oxidase family protein